jgi:hypothetical protein
LKSIESWCTASLYSHFFSSNWRIELHKLYLLTENVRVVTQWQSKLKMKNMKRKEMALTIVKYVMLTSFTKYVRPQGPTVNDKQFPVSMFLLIRYPHTNLAQLSNSLGGGGHWTLQFKAVEYKHRFADRTVRVVRSMWQKNTLKEIIQAKSLL